MNFFDYKEPIGGNFEIAPPKEFPLKKPLDTMTQFLYSLGKFEANNEILDALPLVKKLNNPGAAGTCFLTLKRGEMKRKNKLIRKPISL